MILNNNSMRTTLGLIILMAGIMGIMLAVFTGKIYRDLALENQRGAFEQLIKSKVHEDLRDTSEKAEKFGLSIQSADIFRTAISSQKREDIEASLNQLSRTFFTSTRALTLDGLLVFDPKLNLLGASGADFSAASAKTNPCFILLQEAKLRTGPSRFKTLSRLCTHHSKPTMSILVPIGGLQLKGYLQVIVDPISNLIQLEKELGMPLSIRYPNARIAYKSDLWPTVENLPTLLVSHYNLSDWASQPALQISLAYNVAKLYGTLERTRGYILLHGSIITLLAVLLSLILLQKTAINPIKRLSAQLRLVREDKSHLGEQLEIEGDTEICELATNFNEMTSELHGLYGTLEKMAFTDPLTDLPNRTLYFDRLRQIVQLSERHPTPFAVFMMDIDRFKLINDILGHHIGDILLQEVAIRLKNALRESDTIARLGGDEFAALLPKVIDVDGACTVVKRITEKLNQPIHVKGHNLKIAISIGIVMHPRHEGDSNELMQRAEVAMYHAKKNQLIHAFYTTDIDPHSIQELTLETELKEAIENGLLHLHYQPKVEPNSKRVYGVEALVRWNHPERGFIPPDTFIPLAEQTGLIHPLTQYVLQTALRQCAYWQEKGILLNVAVNLSAHSLRDADLTKMIKTELYRAGVKPESLTLELTETAVMSDPKQALEILSKIDEMGIRLSVDDFGTGYSSLAYLKRLPVDEIKIDRSFVMEMDTDKNDEVIVRSTIDLAHNMGLKVVAEGIETQQALDTLTGLGCDLGQGYHICRPASAGDIEEWIKSSSWTLYEKEALVQQS